MSTTKVYRADGSSLEVNEHQLKFLAKNNLSIQDPSEAAKIAKAEKAKLAKEKKEAARIAKELADKEADAE